MTVRGRLMQALSLVLVLLTLVGCQKIFGEFTIDDSAFEQNGPIIVAPSKGLFTTEWGGQATFTMVLSQEPKANVTVELTSSNTREGTVAPALVTFTKDDWKAPQVITVTGVEDTLADPDKAYKIITAPARSDDPIFNGKNPLDIELVNVDNETAGITVVPRMGLETSEARGQDTFTVVLNSMPDKEVTVNLVSDTPSEGTASPASLIFTPVNWMAPQLVTVTGVDDEVKDPAHPYKIIVTSASDDPRYARLGATQVAVTNRDNDSAGLTVALLSGLEPSDPNKLRTSEHGDSATFSVALTTPPSGDVVIGVASDTLPEGTVAPETLTFTPLNWNAPQIVTVTGAEDEGTADGNQPYLIVLAPMPGDDPDYTAIATVTVPVINVDNDKPGFTVMLLTGVDPNDSSKLLTSEAGTSATFSLALNSRPSEPVTINLSSSMPSEGEVSPAFLTFTTDNWKAPQIVTVTGVDDDHIHDGNPLFYVTTSAAVTADPSYALDPPDVQVTNQDDDSPGVTVVLTKGIDPAASNKLLTEERGTTATFTVALNSKPSEDVTITLTNSNTVEASLWYSSLTFTPVNYNAPQPVTIAGLNDDIVDGNQPYVITVGPASSKDLDFDGKFMSQVQVTNVDDDTPGVIVKPLGGLTTSEGGKADLFTIHLQSQPRSDVSINVASNNASEGKASPSTVTFTPVNWNADQTITVTGVDDDGAQDGNQTYKIILDPPKSKDPNYSGMPDPADVSVTNIDNDSAGFLVTPSSGLITTEAGGKATFTVALTSKPVSTASPGADVTVKFSVSSSKPSEGTVSPSSLTFTNVNWRMPQTVTVTGIDDMVDDGPQPYLITMSLASSTDQNYNAHKPSDVSVTNNDDDSASVVITPLPSTTPSVTTELRGKSTFTVALSSLPTNDVTFTVSSSDISEGTVSPATLKFTPSNGKTPQQVTVTGVNDDLADGNQPYTVRLSNGSSADPNYDGKFGTVLPFLNEDDDLPGVDVVAAADLKTTEKDEGTATFTVALKSQPIANVSIGVSSNNIAEGTVSPSSLLFTPSNWSTPQTVTITGVQDKVADGPQTYRVRLANASSPGMNGDPNYNGQFGTQLDVTNLDDDEAGYSLSPVSSLQTTEAGGLVTFSVVLTSKPAGTSTVTLGVSSSNTNEGTASPSSLLFTGADWDQPHLVTVTGADEKKADGDVLYKITFAADSAYGAPAPAAITLKNVDDDVLGVVVTSTACATTPGTTATFTIHLNSQPSANVTIALTSDNPAEGTVSPESVTFTPSLAGSWDIPQTVTVTGQPGTAGMVTPYNILTGNASAPGETTGYNGYSMVSDVSCTNTAPP